MTERNGCPCLCFFCIMKEPDASLRRAGISTYFKQLSQEDNEENILDISELWHIAMTKPNDSEFPSLGIFKCMANLINKGINNRTWLLTNQNIYIPYYAAHIIGSYTMNKEHFAQIAVQSGVIPPLLELLSCKITWVEQRVAVRALGHLASYNSTFESVSRHEQEAVKMALNMASTCLETVYVEYVSVKDVNERMEYHRNLLTRGVGDLEVENLKAEEWASQLQCWSLYLLNCFACKHRSLSLNLICKTVFLNDLCDMWGGLINHMSPAGVGLIRILCYSKVGRKSIADSPKVINSLCNLSRSSDDWQYIGIHCLLLLLKDLHTRYKIIDIASDYLVDLIELKNLGDKSDIGETITKVLDLKVGKNKESEENRVMAMLMKKEANTMFRLGKIEEALLKYCEAIDICPLKFRRDRMVIYSNKAKCNLLLKDPDSAISDSTRALCLSNPTNSHGKSLWRRAQAYDMKGMAKESLMDCIMFVNGWIKTKGDKVPYHAARMICKQMDATWLFANARSKLKVTVTQNIHINPHVEKTNRDDNEDCNYEEQPRLEVEHKMMKRKTSLSTIIEEPFQCKEAIVGETYGKSY